MPAVAPLQSLFLHFFDPHFLDEVARERSADAVYGEARQATRLAVLASDTVYVPAASYVENDSCRSIVDELRPLWPSGQVTVVGGEATLADYSVAKQLQYRPGSDRHERYAAVSAGVAHVPPYRSRRGSATRDLISSWLARGEDFAGVLGDVPPEVVPGLDKRWLAVPETLAGLAFTPEYVLPLLLEGDDPGPAARLVASRGRTYINSDYFRSYTDELGAGLVTDLVFLGSNVQRPARAVSIPFRALRADLDRRGVLDEVMSAAPERLAELKDDDRVAAAVLANRHVPPELELSAQIALPLTRVRPRLDTLLATGTGHAEAHRYSDRVKTVFETLFPRSLGTGTREREINERRKRIDLLFPNTASMGAFWWAAQHYDARTVTVECKNYKNDPTNREIDQLVTQLASPRGRFGLLLCRTVKDMDTALRRCADARRDHGRLVVPLCDDDLVVLADLAADPGEAPLGDNVLSVRMLQVHRQGG